MGSKLYLSDTLAKSTFAKKTATSILNEKMYCNTVTSDKKRRAIAKDSVLSFTTHNIGRLLNKSVALGREGRQSSSHID